MPTRNGIHGRAEAAGQRLSVRHVGRPGVVPGSEIAALRAMAPQPSQGLRPRPSALRPDRAGFSKLKFLSELATQVRGVPSRRGSSRRLNTAGQHRKVLVLKRRTRGPIGPPTTAPTNGSQDEQVEALRAALPGSPPVRGREKTRPRTGEGAGPHAQGQARLQSLAGASDQSRWRRGDTSCLQPQRAGQGGRLGALWRPRAPGPSAPERGARP